MKTELKEKAIALRRRGFSYREILESVPVAKSTLGLWLRSVRLSKRQKQRLTEKKLASIKRGSEAKHQKRIEVTREIMNSARREIGTITPRELFLIGTMLYWAEGAKEKDYRPGSGIKFSNTDPDMIRIFIRWLKTIFNQDIKDIIIELYIHISHKNRTEEIRNFWCYALGCESQHIGRVYYKKGNPKTLRKNTGSSYHGLARICVRASCSFNRRIAGWIQGVVDCLR